MVRLLSLREVRTFALACLVALVASIVVASSPRTAGADTYPGLADIAAAKAAVSDAQAGVGQLDAAIVSLDNARQAAENAALTAADRYSEAKDTADRTERESVVAAKSASDAAAQLEAARADLAGVAQQAYRDGGTMTSVEAIVGADGFQDVIARTEDNDRAASQLDAVTQKVKAAQLYAAHLLEPGPGQVPFVAIELEQVIEAIGWAGELDYAFCLHDRYCNWSKVDEAVEQALRAQGRNWTIKPPAMSRPPSLIASAA